jgi:hypothetical protein
LTEKQKLGRMAFVYLKGGQCKLLGFYLRQNSLYKESSHENHPCDTVAGQCAETLP